MENLPSSRRDGVDDDIHHCVENAVVIEEVAEDPVRYLVLGPDRAGNLLELAVLDRSGARSDSRHEDEAEVPTPVAGERMRCQETT